VLATVAVMLATAPLQALVGVTRRNTAEIRATEAEVRPTLLQHRKQEPTEPTTDTRYVFNR
jgi:hypothetical protein